ncbi:MULTISPECIES: acyl-CoA dehydrogenase family protein [Rhodanobacter]|uniref:acyl-CoA dehydrogenase family protein n=1 Tax=Rhodanobacter TaxID=75309 RepID=UPI000409DFE1|nr:MULTISPECIES: acyl-CoA dehydrogenase [Rhodanobacter]UJJ53468.1 acyl-CoA dehydrogenase [Rhodanobacter thiooxydans]
MDFAFTEEQQMLQDTTRRYLAREYGFDKRNGILASQAGWSRDIWQALAELGLLAMDIPEQDGGIGAGPVGVMLVAQAAGESLLLEPLLSSAVLATRAIVQLGAGAQRKRWLPGLADGSCIAVLAHDEADACIEVAAISTRTTRNGDDWQLEGRKSAVYHAPAANVLLVSARDDDGHVHVFALPADAAGVRLETFRTVDGQVAADIVFDQVRVPSADRLDGDAALLQSVLDYGLAIFCAETLGSLERTLNATIEYSRSRVQFGVPIGSFQALQHRMADMLAQVEQARSMVYLAISHSQDTDPATRRKALSGAKVLIGEAARYVSQQAVQLHGGMGMTDELDVSHHVRRLLAFELRYGSTDEHRAVCRESLVHAVRVS